MIYLTGATSAIKRVARAHGVGLLAQPGNNVLSQIRYFNVWAADNGCFAAGDSFDLEAYLGWLDRVPGELRSRCLFAVAPDVLGDPVATWRRAGPILPRIRALGYRAALVAQDGLTPARTPWTELDVLFIGGLKTPRSADEWKTSPAAAALVAEARLRGKWAHMGRVNGHRRLLTAALMGCGSVDGTFIARAPDTNVPRLLRWLEKLDGQPRLFGA